MSLEEYLLLPFHPGWKVELLDGVARFAPREAVACGAIELVPRLVAATEAFVVRPVAPEDRDALGRLFDAVFADAAEYCGWPWASFEKERGKVIGGFFAGKRDAPLPASRLALVKDGGAVAGAALVADHGPDSAQLDLLFVSPAWQRRGVATALVGAATNALLAAGKRRLIATWHLANEPAIAWYRRFGFVEEPDLTNARLYLRAAEQELRRDEKLGHLDDAQRQTLMAERLKWENLIGRLEGAIPTEPSPRAV